MTQYRTCLQHYGSGSNNTHHRYYSETPSRYKNVDPRQPVNPEPPNDPSPDSDRAQRRWNRARRRATNALSMSSDDGLSATSSDADELLNDNLVNLEERVPQVYEYRSSELVNPASTLRHASVPGGVGFSGRAEGEAPPWWFACAGSNAARRLGVEWAAWKADRSMKEDLGFGEREKRNERRSRRRSRSKRRESKRTGSSASSGARSEVFELYNKAFETFAAAQAAAQDAKTRRDGQTRSGSRAAIFEQKGGYRRFLELQEASMGQQYEDKTEARSMSDVEAWLQWQNSELLRRAAIKSGLGKTWDWERSKTRQWAEFEEWQRKKKEKSQQIEFIRLRGKEKAFVRRSDIKRAAGLSSLFKTQKTKKTGKNEVNDVEWIDVPTYYGDSEECKWERRVRLL